MANDLSAQRPNLATVLDMAIGLGWHVIESQGEQLPVAGHLNV